MIRQAKSKKHLIRWDMRSNIEHRGADLHNDAQVIYDDEGNPFVLQPNSEVLAVEQNCNFCCYCIDDSEFHGLNKR